MTDQTQVEQTPHIEPVAVIPGPADDFDTQLSAFLNHSMMDETPDGDAIELEETINEAAPAVVATPAPGPGNATQVAPEVAPLAGNLTLAPAADAVDPALVLDMLGFGKDKPATPAAAPAPATAASGQPPAEGPTTDEEAPFVPFKTDFALPPELTTALFESEDSSTRAKALVVLMSSMANTLAQVMDERYKQYHAPRTIEAMTLRQQITQQQNAFVADFYSPEGGFPDLRPHGKLVQRAIEVLHAQDPNISWTDAKPKVGALVRTAIAQLTGKPFVQPAAATPKKAPAAKREQDSAFLSGGVRPAGAGEQPDPNSPAGALADMTQF